MIRPPFKRVLSGAAQPNGAPSGEVPADPHMVKAVTILLLAAPSTLYPNRGRSQNDSERAVNNADTHPMGSIPTPNVLITPLLERFDIPQ